MQESINSRSGYLDRRIRESKYVIIVFIGMILATVLSSASAVVILVTGNRPSYEPVLAFAFAMIPVILTVSVFYTDVIPYLILTMFRFEGEKIFLNHGEAWLYFSTRLFPRMSKYVGYELGHEAAALTMLILKSYKRATLVIGYVWNRSGEKILHAWVELEFLGTNWVIDTMEPGLLVSWKKYYLWNEPDVKRKISHVAFWGYPMVQDFYRLMSNMETSFIFNKLIVFHNIGEPNYRLGFEKLGRDSLDDTGRQLGLIWLAAFGTDKPVDTLLVYRMIKREMTEGPKHRHYRRLMRLAKTRQAAIDAAMEYEKRTGVTPTIFLESLGKFSLRVNGKVI